LCQGGGTRPDGGHTVLELGVRGGRGEAGPRTTSLSS